MIITFLLFRLFRSEWTWTKHMLHFFYGDGTQPQPPSSKQSTTTNRRAVTRWTTNPFFWPILWNGKFQPRNFLQTKWQCLPHTTPLKVWWLICRIAQGFRCHACNAICRVHDELGWQDKGCLFLAVDMFMPKEGNGCGLTRVVQILLYNYRHDIFVTL